ncbi:MAG: aspartate kinase [Candidatus Sumerlaeota bacterium]|nr:aspartate kinase [Candidatus Sumerlaeota bacterium]
MALIVQKFGGSSVADTKLIRNVAHKVIREQDKGNQVVVVVSAMGKTTDKLLSLARELSENPDPRELDMLASTGEQVSIALLAIALHAQGRKAISLTGPQVGIITDDSHSNARISSINDERLRRALDEGNNVIVAGFQGMTEDGEITTLGRGGSDTTAVALAAILKADRCDIYTDVDGVYTADPRIVKNARKLDEITYDEMLELATLGAKVLHNRSVEFAKRYNVPLQVLNSFNDHPGTMVVKETKKMEDIVVSGVAYNRAEAKVSIIGVPDRPGVAADIFGALSEAGIVVDIIIQNVSHSGLNDISFTVARGDLKKTLGVIDAAAKKIGAQAIESNPGIAKVSVVGAGMQSHTGVAARMFRALASKGINILSISTSEIKISCVINEQDVDAAVQVIHDALELGTK